MRLFAKAQVDHSDLSSSQVLSQSAKDVEVELARGDSRGLALTLCLKGKPLTLPVAPPMVLYGNRVHEGRLGIKFMRVKLKPWEPATKNVQVTLASPDTKALAQLRDGINHALQRQVSKNPAAAAASSAVQRRPLAPRPTNTLHTTSRPDLHKPSCKAPPEAPLGSGSGAGKLPIGPALAAASYGSFHAAGGRAGGAAHHSGLTSHTAQRACDSRSSASMAGRGAGLPSRGGPTTSAASSRLMGSCTFSMRGIPQQPVVGSSADSRDGSVGGCAPGGEELAPLSEEQARALELVRGGKSIFFTGCAGTGKSLLLRHILQLLPPSSTFVTATTGLAACQLGGSTINSFAGIGRGEGGEEALARMAGRGDALQRWRRATALIVDEISMMDGRLFDTLEAVARRVRGSQAPFGGIQLILSGDFHQLPPVVKGGREAEQQRRFCFEAGSWGRCVHACVQLSQVFRQSDQEFVGVLAKVRGGSCPEAVLQRLLAACRRPLPTDDGILPTKLFTHREDVDRINAEQLAGLSSPPVDFPARDAGPADVLATACPAKKHLQLKVGAQVMLLRNLSQRQGLVNGARGVVERFSGSQQLPVIRFVNGEVVTLGREKWTISSGGRVVAQRLQLPLDLGWAMSVHKSQGMTLDRVEVSLERAFEPGMAYVALSRVKSLEGLRILGSRISVQALRADPRVVAFYNKLHMRQLRGLPGSP